MDVGSELSFPPLQLPLHLSHPEGTSRIKLDLPRQKQNKTKLKVFIRMAAAWWSHKDEHT